MKALVLIFYILIASTGAIINHKNTRSAVDGGYKTSQFPVSFNYKLPISVLKMSFA